MSTPIAVRVTQARNEGRVPRVHGNGFIQLDLDPTTRLHVWGHPDIPRQSITSAIHDHVFDFRSEVLVGELHNYRYNVVADRDGVFRVYRPRVRQGEDTILVADDEPNRVHAHQSEIEVVPAGDAYSMERGQFHETVVNAPTITLMRKNGKTLGQNPNGARPRVLVPFEFQPDNNFNRYDALPVEKIWWIIEAMLIHL